MVPVIMEDVGIAMNRRQRAKAATTAKVLEAARDLFETVGFEGATMRAIAKQAGMSTGAIFANYRDKAELYASVYGHAPISPDAGRRLMQAAKALMLASRESPNWSDLSDTARVVVDMDKAIADAEGRA